MGIGLNGTQVKITVVAGVLMALAFLFPPVVTERTFSGLTDGYSRIELVDREPSGWRFIGAVDFAREPSYDPDSLRGRWLANTGSSLSDIRRGKVRVHWRNWLLEFLVIAAAAGTGLFLTRSKSPD